MDVSKLNSATRTDCRADRPDRQTTCDLIYIYVCVNPGEFTHVITHGSATVATAVLKASVNPSCSESTERMRTALAELDKGTPADSATSSHFNSMLAEAALAYVVRTNTWNLLNPKGVVHFLILAQPAATAYDFRPLLLPEVDSVPISTPQLAEIMWTVTLKLKRLL